jgi:hypothetical protein
MFKCSTFIRPPRIRIVGVIYFNTESDAVDLFSDYLDKNKIKYQYHNFAG